MAAIAEIGASEEFRPCVKPVGKITVLHVLNHFLGPFPRSDIFFAAKANFIMIVFFDELESEPIRKLSELITAVLGIKIKLPIHLFPVLPEGSTAAAFEIHNGQLSCLFAAKDQVNNAHKSFIANRTGELLFGTDNLIAREA